MDASVLQYDVIVVGGGPGGIGAAVAAARQGAHTALLERGGVVGGMLTLGQVQPILGSVAPGTFYDEIVALVSSGHEDMPPINTHNGIEIQVDPEEAKGRLLQLLIESGVDVYLHTPVVEVLEEDNRVTGVLAGSAFGLQEFRASVIIDATGDGSAAAMAGADFEIGRESDGRCQPATIEFIVDHLDPERAFCCWGGSDPVKLPDGREYRQVCKEAAASGELPSNVTIVRLHQTYYADERNVNATQANGFDTLSPMDEARAQLLLRKQIEQIVAFLRKNAPGFENCRVKSSGGAIGVRETRRITGMDRVEDIDVETGRKRPDVVVHNAWFLIDIHNPAGGGQAEKFAQPAQPYDIPYGALVARDIDGLMMAGRCISGTHRAHASYRVMAICLAIGQAAGTAAALSAKHNCSPRQLKASLVQEALQAQGVKLFD